MEPGLKTISNLFDGSKQFIVPYYQRPYAWENEQLKDFIDDILNHKKERKYFYGTILLKESGRDTELDFEILEIVDGQQRIITLTILFYTLINLLKKLNYEKNLEVKRERYIKYREVHKLKLSEIDNEFFQTYIVNEADQNPISFNTPSQKRLWEARSYFKKSLLEIEFNKNKLVNLLEIVENAEVLIYSVKESAEASLIFETTNDRGKRLTNLEKIKSFLMYKTYITLGKNSEESISNINARFRDIYLKIEKINLKLEIMNLKEVDEDDICRYHFICFHDWTNKKDYQNYLIQIKEKINELIKNGKKEEIVQFIDQYTITLRDIFNSFEKLLNSGVNSLNEIIYLERIAVFYPIILKSVYYDQTTSCVNLKKILDVLSIFSFRVFSLKFKRPQDVDVTLNRMARSFTGNYNAIFIDILSNLNNYSPLHDFINKLKIAKLYDEIDKNSQRFLFWKYENFIRVNEQPVCGEMPFEEFNGKDRRYQITIEHITAQTPKNDLEFEDVMNEDFQDSYLHNLGNLTIDPNSSNASKGNEIWRNKNGKYFQKAPFKTQLELSDFIDDKIKKWGKDSINKRRNRILTIAKKLWGDLNLTTLYSANI